MPDDEEPGGALTDAAGGEPGDEVGEEEEPAGKRDWEPDDALPWPVAASTIHTRTPIAAHTATPAAINRPRGESGWKMCTGSSSRMAGFPDGAAARSPAVHQCSGAPPTTCTDYAA